MPYRQDAFAPGEVYHVYNRGLDGRRIFVQQRNYVYLLQRIKVLVAELRVTVLAHCLMPNHYHLVLRQDGDASISTFIQRLFLSYVQAFNRQQGRKGPLFQSRFQHAHVDRDEYLVHLCRYVHLNPVAAGLVAAPEAWPYSNYLEWIEERAGTLVDMAFVRRFFETAEAYAAFVEGEIPAGLGRKLGPYLLD